MYLRSVIVEASDREKSTVRDIEAYMSLRRRTAACQIVLAIPEFGLNLVDEVYYHPAVTELINCVVELIIIDNVSVICRSMIILPTIPCTGYGVI